MPKAIQYLNKLILANEDLAMDVELFETYVVHLHHFSAKFQHMS